MSEDNKTASVLTGRVVSDKMDKTITVSIERKIQHSLYGKYIKRSTKLQAHDEDNQCSLGDMVTIKQCRPLSRKKRFQLVDIVSKAS
ncbi:MAG: 30S ribosomal protein S17 [Gammaproteobacteria bacterium]|nr:30S ribosomal protein S17 [Gammaproteobacteria bacterium]